MNAFCFLVFLVGKIFPLTEADNKTFNKKLAVEDLNLADNFFILLVTEKEGFNCPVCNFVKGKLADSSVDYKILNFCEKLEFAVKFFCWKFPSIFYKHGEKFYSVELSELDNILDNKINLLAYKKVNRLICPTSLITRCVSLFVRYTYRPILKLHSFLYEIGKNYKKILFALVFLYFSGFLIYFFQANKSQ